MIVIILKIILTVFNLCIVLPISNVFLSYDVIYPHVVLPFYPEVLQKVDLPIISNAECLRQLQPKVAAIPPTSLCAGFEEGGKDTCFGDGGGPLMCFDDLRGRWVLAGVTSWGDGCAEPNKPGVYMAVSKYIEYIQLGMVESMTSSGMLAYNLTY